jgi:PAS domain S-box-containing protein
MFLADKRKSRLETNIWFEFQMKPSPTENDDGWTKNEERLIIDTAPTLIHTGRPDGFLDFFNQRWLEYLGVGLKEVEGWRWMNMIHPDDVDGLVATWRLSLATGNPFEGEARVRRADGQYRWFLHRKVPLRDAQGTILKWYGSSLDIEDRKQAEEALRRSEALLRRNEFYLHEGHRLSNSGSWSFTPDRICDYWSPQLYEILGFDPENGIPTLADYLALVHPEDREKVERTIDQMIAEGVGCDIKKRILRADGLRRVIRCVGVPVLEDGKVTRFIGTLMDVTEQEEMTQQLRRRETYLEEAQRLSQTGSFGWSVANEEIVWSDETFRILGYDGKVKPTLELVLQRVHPDDKALVQELIERASHDKQDFRIAHRLLMPGGAIKHLQVVGHAVRDERGNVEFIGSVMDVTERKRAQQELEQAFQEIKALKDQLQRENIALREEIGETSMFEEIVGASRLLKAVLARVTKVAPTDTTVLITGETGTGKELIARAIHKRSLRSKRPFVKVSCAAIPQSLIASELFGHEKGAFTGALQQRIGRFELAEGGTIFLDEIGELPSETQVALLRVLQEREFERVGGARPISVDVRVIVATNRDLKIAIAGGEFRSDLFYRVNVFPIEMPPLRDRREDIPMLVKYFIERYARKAGKQISSIGNKTLKLLQSYPWPGNIRELQNVVERSVIVCEGESFSVDESWLSHEDVPSPLGRSALSEKLAAEEKGVIEGTLAQTKGRVSGPYGAAAKLGMPPSTLESKIRSLQIDKKRFKNL